MDVKENYKGSKKLVNSENLYENLKNLDTRRQEKLHSSLFHNETITVVDQEENYAICTSSDMNALEVVDDSIATPVDGQVALSIVQAFVPTAQVGEYYQHIEKIEHDEEIEKETYRKANDSYTKDEVDSKILQSTTGLEMYTTDEYQNFIDSLVINPTPQP